jgi:hypothetical protein
MLSKAEYVSSSQLLLQYLLALEVTDDPCGITIFASAKPVLDSSVRPIAGDRLKPVPDQLERRPIKRMPVLARLPHLECRIP